MSPIIITINGKHGKIYKRKEKYYIKLHSHIIQWLNEHKIKYKLSDINNNTNMSLIFFKEKDAMLFKIYCY